jgi:hypothetical protein
LPLSEYDTKEALRAATDWLGASDLPGSAAAREGIADTIPLVMMGLVEPDDLDDLAAIVEKHGRAVHDAAAPDDVGSSKGRVRLRAFTSARCRAMKIKIGFLAPSALVEGECRATR